MERSIINNLLFTICFIVGIVTGMFIGSQITIYNLSNVFSVEASMFDWQKDLELSADTPVPNGTVINEVTEMDTVEIGPVIEKDLDVSTLNVGMKIKPMPVEEISSNNNTVEEEVLSEPSVEELIYGDTVSVPDYCGTFKAFMSYKSITSTGSLQYKLQQSEWMWIDEFGMQRYNNDYVVAVGKYFADSVGDRLLIKMKNGAEFTAIVGDFKATAHTDEQNMYNPGSMSVLEFLVDTKTLDKTIMKMGDVSYLPAIDMSGQVESMTEIR